MARLDNLFKRLQICHGFGMFSRDSTLNVFKRLNMSKYLKRLDIECFQETRHVKMFLKDSTYQNI